MSYPGAIMALEEVTVVRETCQDCGTDLRMMESYLAEEDARELEVLLWRCPDCGDTHEAIQSLPEPWAA